MSSISLRDQLREIEKLLESGQAAEASPLCQAILQIFPKNLATYRLMGSAYLENGRYSESADIFLRLLSSLPDDFTAHLGLSLVREREGKLQAALWHCERAIEVKPYSQVVQAELNRLAVKQNPSLEQPAETFPIQSRPVILNRVSLAKMYLLGNCYLQAIAELQAAVQENPTRPDILILLACAFEQSGLDDQAKQTSEAALQKLPFSLHANRILFTQALLNDDASAAVAYKQRLQELDPYWAYVTPGALDAELVPDHAVSLENIL